MVTSSETERDGAHGPDGPPRAAWAGGWACILLLGLWLAQLSVLLLLGAAVGALAWTSMVLRRRRAWSLAAALLLWGAVGAGAGVQYRLWRVAHDWPTLREHIETRAATHLGTALDGMVERGEQAVVEAGSAVGPELPQRVPAPLFERMEEIRSRSGVSALAVFNDRGALLAWAGEHRGVVPLSVRRGESRYLFQEGPLFSYVYFTQRLQNGGTAVAAVLAESKLEGAARTLPFAEEFARREGLVPRFAPPSRVHGTSVWDWSADRPILSVTFATLTQLAWWRRVVERGRWGVAVLWLAGLSVLTIGWYRRRMRPPGAPVALVTLALLAAPMGEMLGAEDLFSPLKFVLPLRGDVTLGMLLVLLIGFAVWLLTRVPGGGGEGRRLPWWAQGLCCAAVVPLALLLMRRAASAGLLAQEPAGGFPLRLALTLLLALPFFLLLRYGATRPRSRRVTSILLTLAFGLAAALAIALVRLSGPRHPPGVGWSALWAVPFVLAALGLRGAGRSALRAWLVAAGLAAIVALSQLWVLHVNDRLQSAEREISRLGTETDPFLDFLLRQFAEGANRFAEQGEEGMNLLYHSWIASGLAREGYEARLTIWSGGEPIADLPLSESGPPAGMVESRVAAAADSTPVVEHFTKVEGLHYLLLAPLPGGKTISVAVPPRSRLGDATALARFLTPDGGAGLSSAVEALYLVPVANPSDTLRIPPVNGVRSDVRWIRTQDGWRSETRARFPAGWMHVHLFVRTSTFPMLLVRGVLAVLLLLAVLGVLWAAARLVCGELRLLPRTRAELVRSFRVRLTLALFVFFLIPTAAFGVVAYGAVSREVVRSAEAVGLRALGQAVPNLAHDSLSHLGAELGTDLLLYRRGTLVNAAAPEVIDLGLFDSWLHPDVFLGFATGENLEEVESRRLENGYLVAYRRLAPSIVLAAPIPLASAEIARRQADFRDVALLISLCGAALSIFLSLLVGRALTRPIDRLSEAAARVGSGNLGVRLPEGRLDEFGGVYRSFNRMVRRVRRARTALLQETRRTEAIVSEAATGVLALDALGRPELVNARATEILGAPVPVGEPLPAETPLLRALAGAYRDFWNAGATEAARELEVDGRIVRLRFRRLRSTGGPRGTVVSLEDVTSEIRTARVLAWGEMARQVAHEIKNPLTPIKLAVQHLRRAFADRRADYGEILDRNVESILQEIDRLGEIARAFSRFGTPGAPTAEPEAVDVTRAAEETLALYRGAGAGIDYELESDGPTLALARTGELKEVLINLLENARDALDGEGEIAIRVRSADEGRWVEVEVADTGEGIPPELLPRIFEPHFSTRTSGTGLGLAIVRRLVEGWGGEVSAHSRPGLGTRVILRLRPAAPGT